MAKVGAQTQVYFGTGAKAQTIALKDSKSGSGQQEDPLETLENPDAQRFSRLGELLQMREHHRAAAIEYEKARKEVGDQFPSLNYRLAKAYSLIGKSEQAIDLLTKSFHVHPNDTDGRLQAKRLTRARAMMTGFDAVKWRNLTTRTSCLYGHHS